MEGMLFGVEPFYILTYLIAGTIGATTLGLKILKLTNQTVLRVKNTNKAILVIAEHMDEESVRLHPERSEHNIKSTIETILEE